MHNDLTNPTLISRVARRLLVLSSIVLAIGLTGVVFARVEQRTSRIIWVGRVIAPQVAVVASGPTAKRTMLMEVTAYCPCEKCCGPDAQGITASGKLVSYNDGKFVAADTRVLPFGTKLHIPGYSDAKPVEVIDRGGAIKGPKLDVFFPTHEEALKWGRQKLQVAIHD